MTFCGISDSGRSRVPTTGIRAARSLSGSVLAFLTGLLLVCSGPLPVRAQQEMARAAALADSGMAHLDRGELDSARALFEQALAVSDNYFRAVLGLGRIALELEEDTPLEILNIFQEAVRLMPTSSEAHYNLALSFLHIARVDPIRGGVRSARKELALAIELNPSHPDAHYQLALIVFDRLDVPRPEEARDLLIHQVEAVPAHRDAWQKLLDVHMALGEWDDAARAAGELITLDPEATEAYPLLAGAFWQEERFDEAMRVFENYFGILDADELGLYLNIGYILTPDEQREYRTLDDEGRISYRNHYWAQRDPDPKTLVNERLLEHFIRVAWARLEFGEDWPWDARGDFYVRYGEPDIRTGQGRPFPEDFIDDDPFFRRAKREFYESMGLSPMQDTISASDGIGGRRSGFQDASGDTGPVGSVERTPERWIYRDRGVDMVFNDPVGRGRYMLTSNLHRQLMEQMEERLPIMSPEEDKIEYIDLMDVAITFRGSDGLTAVEYAFALLPEEFGSFRSLTGAWTTLDVDVRLFTPGWHEVTSTGDAARRIEVVPQVRIRGIPLFVDATRLEVEPGEYILATMLTDPETGRRAGSEEQIEVPDYSGDELMVSNILPAALITEVGPGREGRFIRGDLEVLPLPGRALQADQPLFIYYEAYNLSKDEFGATDYQVEYAISQAPEGQALMTRLFQGIRSIVTGRRGRVRIASSVTRQGISTDMASYLEIDLSDLRAETWELRLTITDLHTGVSRSSSLIFRTLPIRNEQDRQP